MYAKGIRFCVTWSLLLITLLVRNYYLDSNHTPHSNNVLLIFTGNPIWNNEHFFVVLKKTFGRFLTKKTEQPTQEVELFLFLFFET